jgi:hypothetical protein
LPPSLENCDEEFQLEKENKRHKMWNGRSRVVKFKDRSFQHLIV